jgi:flagellar basal-body rod modification protein FlgD
MSTINTTNATTNSSGAATGVAAGQNAALNSVNFDTFLKLLVAQLKNQDPLNPMEGTEFTAQLAQYSSVEQQINSNNYLKQLVAERDYGEQTLATSYLSKDVLGPGNLFAKTGGATQLGYEVGKDTTRVTLEIINNQTGGVIKTINGDPKEGTKTLVWDGKNDDGQMVADSAYTLRVRAVDAEGKVKPSQGYVYGRVNSVLNDGANISLQMADGRSIAANSVIGVRN